MFERKLFSSSAKKRLFIVVIVLLLLLLIPLFIYLWRSANVAEKKNSCQSSHESYRVRSDSSMGRYPSSVIVVDDDQCSRIGKSLLERGGNAIDAGIGAALCNGLISAHSMGIGGGNVLLIYSKSVCLLNSDATIFCF